MGELPTGTVTFLFTDLESSTRLWEAHPEAMQAALARHDALLAEAVEAHHGRVVKTTGDGLHAVFATADAGVCAAVAGQRFLAAESWGPVGEMRVRMGLHTGVAEERGGDYFGPVLNRAARLMGVAHPGQVLCSQATADLVRDVLPPSVALVELGRHRLRDVARPEAVFQVTHPDLPADFPRLHSLDASPGNLPRQVTSFVGRDDEMARVGAELNQTPLVTLTGVGGVGKTRLALEVAAETRSAYRDGGWLCELGGVRDAEAVPDAVLEAFGVERRHGLTATPLLVEFLRAKELLVVLDNCEHLLKAVARLVGEVVRTCPGVRVLATSREGLNVAGERILVVSSLEVPEDNAGVELEAIAGCDAVQLFLERAQAVRAGFVLDAANAGAVAQVCRRLDGVPLAIELAAARAVMLTPAELARRLDQRFRVLTGSERGTVERHQTLRAAIDWSYELLGDAERCLLDRLSVFAGGFTLAAAEAVTAGDGIAPDEVFELLAGLVARSLVVADTEGTQTRYRLLETIRQYAQERLDAGGDTARVRNEHASYYADFAETAAAGLTSPDELGWYGPLTREVDNFRAALAWAAQGEDADTALRLLELGEAGGVNTTEVSPVLRAAAESALAIPGIAENPRYPVALVTAALHAYYQGDLEGATRYSDEALAAQQRLGVEPSPSLWWGRMWVALTEARVDEYLEYSERMAAICRARDDRWRLAMSLASCAMARSLKGDDLALAIVEIDEALALAQQVAVPTVIAATQANAAFVLADAQPKRARALVQEAVRFKELHEGIRLPVHPMAGDVAERLGEPRQALEFFATGMEELHWLGQSEHVGRMLRRIGILLVGDDPEAAAVITGAGAARSIGYTMANRVVRAYEQATRDLDTALGTERNQELQARGAAMDDHGAVVFARAAVARVLEEPAALGPLPSAATPTEDNGFRKEGDT